MKRVEWSDTKGSGRRGESLGRRMLDGVVFFRAGSGELHCLIKLFNMLLLQPGHRANPWALAELNTLRWKIALWLLANGVLRIPASFSTFHFLLLI